MSGIGVILNPHSRSNRKTPKRLEEFGFIVGDKGSCHATKTLNQIEDLAREFKQREIEILGIAGGDGTYHKTLQTFVHVYNDQPLPKIALLRGGTMNNMAWQLGITGSPEKILSDIILNYHNNNIFHETQLNMISVNNHYGFICGLGVVERFLKIYQNSKTGEPSPLKAATLLAKATISSLFNGNLGQQINKRFNATITIDGQTQAFRNYSMVFLGTMTTLGLNFRALYRANTQHGRFQFVGISSTGRHLLTTFPSAILGKPAQSENYIDEMCEEVIIEFDTDIPYIIDGDHIENTRKIVTKTGPLLTLIKADT